MTTNGSTQPSPSPDPAQAKRPGQPRAPKTVSTTKGTGSTLPGNPKGTGAGQGSVRRGGRGGR